MIQRGIDSLGLQMVQVVVVGGCVIGLLTGCSSRLQTTIVSGSEAPKVQVTQLEPETVVVEEVIAQPVQKETRMDIPVEEPARPAPRRELPADIFATPRTPEVPSEMAVRSEVEPSLPVQEEPMASSLPLVSEPAIQQPAVGIPPIAFEPEMPALPRLRQDAGSSASQEAPIEVAKVMPHETEPAEIITETLEAALSDIYFDYDRFAIRDDAMQVLKANAELLLAKFADAKIVIEGHCDERGTQSYNMVLGERRAKAVKSFLEDLGASAENLQVVSFGKDKPFCQEQTEECWQENRRGHFVIK